jgi:hypothetical protein
MKTVVTIYCILIFACNKPQVLTEQTREKIRLEVQSMFQDYATAVKQSGLTAEFNYLDSSADFFWVPPGYTSALSYDSIAVILKRNATGYKIIDNTYDTLIIIPVSLDLAVYTARLHSNMTDTAQIYHAFTLIETGTVIRRTTGWKLLSGQTALLEVK